MFFTDDIECGTPFHVLICYILFYKESLQIFGLFPPYGVAWRILAPWAEIEPVPLAVKTWIPNHLTSRELPGPFLIFLFVFLLLSVKSYLYILDRNSLSDVYFTDIFSKFVACFLILLILSFTEQKFWNLINSNLSTFVSCIKVLIKNNPIIQGLASFMLWLGVL